MVARVRRVDVLIASPGDASPARDVVERSLHEWNVHRGDVEDTILRPLRWEIGSVPLSGQGDAQSVINHQLVDKADIVIAIFYHKLGTATARAISGTAEEIERSVDAGKPVHLYFSESGLPYNHDPEQFGALMRFRERMQQSGLIGTFGSELALRGDVVRAIEFDLRRAQEGGLATNEGPARAPEVPSDSNHGIEFPVSQFEVPRLEIEYQARGSAESASGVVEIPERIIVRNRSDEWVRIWEPWIQAVTDPWRASPSVRLEGRREIRPRESSDFTSADGMPFPAGTIEGSFTCAMNGTKMYQSFSLKVPR